MIVIKKGSMLRIFLGIIAITIIPIITFNLGNDLLMVFIFTVIIIPLIILLVGNPIAAKVPEPLPLERVLFGVEEASQLKALEKVIGKATHTLGYYQHYDTEYSEIEVPSPIKEIEKPNKKATRGDVIEIE